MALGLFGHLGNHHFITPHQVHETRRSGLRPGDVVRFEYRGERLIGQIRRITCRATVMVDKRVDALPDGYENWVKFYVPLPLLERVIMPG